MGDLVLDRVVLAKGGLFHCVGGSEGCGGRIIIIEVDELSISASVSLSPPAPAPVKRTTGGMGKLWEPAPHSDYKFCQYVSPSVAHDSGPCDCMTSPSPFGPFY